MLDFKNLQFLSCSPCRPPVLLPHTKFRWNRTIGRRVMAKKANFKMRPPPSWILKISIFGHLTATVCNIWCSVSNGSRYILRRPCRHCRRCRPVIKTSVDGLYSYNKYTKNLCKRTVFYFNLSSKTWSYNFTMCRPICGDCLCQRNIGWESLSRAHTGMCICVECTFVACF